MGAGRTGKAEDQTSKIMAKSTLPNNWTPRPYQEPLWEYLSKGGKRAVTKWHRRCLATNTMVTMADGSWRHIQELKQGDKILSWVDGVYCEDEVTDVWNAGVKPVVRVSCSGLPDVISTKDHRFYIQKQGWKEIGKVKSKGVTGSTDNLTIYSTTAFDGVAVPQAELYGHLVTDGSVHEDQSPKYTNTKPELIERVAELSLAVGVTPRIRAKGNGWDIGLSNGTAGGGETKNPIKELFRQEGALNKRSFRRIPKSLWGADIESLTKFFGAVLDGDGSLWIFKPKTAFGGKSVARAAEVKIHAGESESLAWDYYWLLRKLGVVASRVCFERESCWTVRIWTAEAVLTLLGQIYCHHPEKETRRQEILAGVTAKKSRLRYGGTYMASASIEDDGLCETWDIETKSHARFFANGYLVHNSGKDDVFLHHTACSMLERPGNYWYMLPEYSQARKSMWDAINPNTGNRRIDDVFPKDLRSRFSENEMIIGIDRSTFQLVGSDNFNSLVGSPPVGLVFSEYAISNPSAWGYLMPILEENGGWAGFNSTPRGKNHFKGMCEFAQKEKGWFFSSLNADDTQIFTPEQLLNILRQLQATHGDEYGMALFQQEYYVSFEAAMPGAIWGDCIAKLEQQDRIDTVPHTAGFPVFTGSDLGFDDSTVFWFYQMIDGEINVIDYLEDHFKDVEFYALALKNKYDSGYRYGTHWLPHDAKPRTLASGGKSILQQFLDFNNDHKGILGDFAIAPKLDVQEGIQAARATFPHCQFDIDKCELGIDHLKAYRREFDEENNVFSSTPKHDGASHAADAFRTVGVTWRKSKAISHEMSPEQKLFAGNIIGMPFGELKKQHFKQIRANGSKYSL